jgi:hypothetical protein
MPHKQALKAYKYRVCPTDAQVVFFAKNLECCRFVPSKMLEEKLPAYKKKESIQRIIPANYKKEFLLPENLIPYERVWSCLHTVKCMIEMSTHRLNATRIQAYGACSGKNQRTQPLFALRTIVYTLL